MSRSYTLQDVYVDDHLAFAGAQVIDHGNRIIVRAHVDPDRRPLRMETALTLTDTTAPVVAEADTGVVRTWIGTDPDGEQRTVAAVGRSNRCLPCTRR